MAEAKIIVCEKTGKWATSLRMVLSDLQLRIRETRSVVEMLRAVEKSPAALVALELSEKRLETQLCCLFELARRFPQSRAIVLAERGMDQYETSAREAGAMHFLSSPRGLVALSRFIRRHLAQVSLGQDHGLQEAIWSRLPWASD